MGKTPAKSASPAHVKMIRPEDQQPKLCVVEVSPDRIDEFRDAGWVEKTDAEIEEIEKARAPKTEPQPEEVAQSVQSVPEA